MTEIKPCLKLDELLFFCERCGFVPVKYSLVSKDANGPCDPWSDLLCKECLSIINTVKLREGGDVGGNDHE